MALPEEQAFNIPDLKAWVLLHRPELLVAALTVLRAYFVAGRPGQGLSPFGSFEAWSDLIAARFRSVPPAWQSRYADFLQKLQHATEPLTTAHFVDTHDPIGRGLDELATESLVVPFAIVSWLESPRRFAWIRAPADFLHRTRFERLVLALRSGGG